MMLLGKLVENKAALRRRSRARGAERAGAVKVAATCARGGQRGNGDARRERERVRERRRRREQCAQRRRQDDRRLQHASMGVGVRVCVRVCVAADAVGLLLVGGRGGDGGGGGLRRARVAVVEFVVLWSPRPWRQPQGRHGRRGDRAGQSRNNLDALRGAVGVETGVHERFVLLGDAGVGELLQTRDHVVVTLLAGVQRVRVVVATDGECAGRRRGRERGARHHGGRRDGGARAGHGREGVVVLLVLLWGYSEKHGIFR